MEKKIQCCMFETDKTPVACQSWLLGFLRECNRDSLNIVWIIRVSPLTRFNEQTPEPPLKLKLNFIHTIIIISFWTTVW